MFSGLSSLRKEEKKEPTAQNKALQDYLKKYAGEEGGDGAGDKKKKRKKKPKPEAGGAVQIVDTDLTGFEGVAAAAERKRAPPSERAAGAGSDGEGSGGEGARGAAAAMRCSSRCTACNRAVQLQGPACCACQWLRARGVHTRVKAAHSGPLPLLSVQQLLPLATMHCTSHTCSSPIKPRRRPHNRQS